MGLSDETYDRKLWSIHNSNYLTLKILPLSLGVSFPLFICRWQVGKSNPITGLNRSRGFQKVEAPRFQDNQHMKVVRLSALCTGRFLPSGNIPGTHFC